MNPIRQRQDLNEAYELKCISKNQLAMAVKSPVFLINGNRPKLTDIEVDWILDNVMTDSGKDGNAPFPTLTPFDCFRLAYADYPIYEQWWVNHEKALCLRCDDGYSDKKVKMYSLHYLERRGPGIEIWIWCNGIKWDVNTKRAGKVELMSEDKDFKRFTNAPFQSLGIFLFDVMSGINTVLKVSKEQPGRSVEWHSSHSHYLILAPKQAQKCQQHKRGPTDHELKRGVHWRRAHLRRLTSEKFIHKRGLLVAVKKAWVGPIEWIGLDSKTYKVVSFEKKKIDS